MPPITVRSFDPRDAPATSALIAETMRRSNAGDYPMDRLEALIAYFTPAKLCELAAERHCLVAVAGTTIVGTAARSGTELVTFFVHPDHQRAGIGALMLRELEQVARESGIALLRVDASITGASFYEREGYRRTGAIAEGTAGPHVQLVKDIRNGTG